MHTIGFERHDHRACIADCVDAARSQCADAGLRFTPIRQRVLEILLRDHRALGAYDVLDRMREQGLSAQPPAAYRALDFLVENGFAHKIERLNAFIACAHPCEEHAPAFLICRNCRSVAEAPSEAARAQLGATAKEAGFRILRTVVEAEGICPNCAAEGAA